MGVHHNSPMALVVWFKDNLEDTKMFIGNIYFQNSLEVPKRTKNNHPHYFYVVLCHEGRTRYIKVGTTSQSPAQRFKHYPYIVDEVICIVECYKGVELAIEENCRCEWGDYRGITHIPKDRFTYFNIKRDILRECLKEMITEQLAVFMCGGVT